MRRGESASEKRKLSFAGGEMGEVATDDAAVARDEDRESADRGDDVGEDPGVCAGRGNRRIADLNALVTIGRMGGCRR